MTTETFGPEHRPIVEFALDNVQTLKLRKTKLQSQKQASHDDDNADENDVSGKIEGDMHVKDRKRKTQEHSKPMKDAVPDTGANGKSPEGRKFRRQKDKQKGRRAEEYSHNENSDALSTEQKNNQGGQSRGGAPLEGQNTATDNKKAKSGNKVDVGSRKRKVQNQGQEDQKVSKKRPKKNKESAGKDVVDKLDMLIEQYRSKFSHKGSQGNDGDKKPSKQLRKWFEL